MKKTLLILSLLFACTFSSNAQSDATWEETIEFIEKRISWLNHSNSSGFSAYTAKYDNELLIIKNYFIRTDKTEFTRIYYIDFTVVSDIKQTNCGFNILTNSSFIYELKEDGEIEKGGTPQCSLDYNCDMKSNANRIYKALNHLKQLQSKKKEKF